MDNKVKGYSKEFLSKFWEDFDGSTLISPNKNGDKENGISDITAYELNKESLVRFCKYNSISIIELLLAGLTLTLNKFNFSNETLIFNQNNVPFGTKFEKRDIAIEEFLKTIHEKFNETLQFDEYVDDDDFVLKPEFYYSFNQDLKSDISYSNYLNIKETAFDTVKGQGNYSLAGVGRAHET